MTDGRAGEAGRTAELARLFLRLGATAFGGPAAHIAMMHDEVVGRRGWLQEQHFLDLLGATNLIPGPTSTEMAIHIGFVRARWRGLLVAGLCFMAPATLIVLGLAWAYERYGSTPEANFVLYGIEPVVIAVVLQALVSLARLVVVKALPVAVGVGALILYLAGLNEIAVILAAGIIVMLARGVAWPRRAASAALPLWWSVAQTSAASPELGRVFAVFLKFGALVFGSGYVLLAFLRTDLVERLGWLTDQQLIDAVAIGQLTPGPLFTTATFIGYLLGGAPAALLATVGIFLPSFLLVAAVNPLVPRLRDRPATAALLDGINAGALGLMAGVAWQLAGHAVVDVPTGALLLGALIALLRYKVNSAWVIAAGAGAGALISLVR